MTAAAPAAPGAPGDPEPRTAARMFLLDTEDRVLLMHERRDIGSERTHWITPGGGVEDGESLAQAAVREVYEETGLRIALAADAAPVHVDQVVFSIAGATYRQTNHYFFSRCAAGLQIRPAGHTEVEQLVVLGHRWWELDELEHAEVDSEPAGIVDILRARSAVEGDR